MSAYDHLEIPCPICGVESHPEAWFDEHPRGSCPSCDASQEAVKKRSLEVLEA